MRSDRRPNLLYRRSLAALLVAALALAIVQVPASAIVSEGSLDPSFAGVGQIATPVGTNTTDRAFAVAIQKDGKIVVAGLAHIGTINEIAIVRYLNDGTLDGSFGGGDGKVTTPIGAGAQANAIALQADGKIVVAGYGRPHATPHFAVARYNSNGTLDPTFNGSGTALTCGPPTVVTASGTSAFTRAAMRAALWTEIVVAEKPTWSGASAATCCATVSTGVPLRFPSTTWTRWPRSRATAASTRVPIPGISSSPSRTRSIARFQQT